MFKKMISNIHYWIGSKDLVNGHAHLRKCHDRCTLYTVDHDGRAISLFSSTERHVKMINEALAPLMREIEGYNG